jgi:hypothetical protein
MASIFDIFGEIDLKTGGFEGSISKVVSRLKNADSALDSTIARSNKLGDTSATVARRYEKLSEGIKAQRDRLLDNALAFEKGEINAAKFSSVVTSVDKATTGLSAKLKDAKARLVELDETGLTHFQQSISTAVDNATSKLELFRQKIIQTQSVPQSTDLLKNLFGNLSGQQKTQLSFQLNDIISGLAMGQNPLQILAQQGGQVVQVFQQGKKAQEGVAAATTAAATAQAAFAASAQTSAIAQASVATSSAATAASMQAASGQATILGASVGTLAAALSAGAIAGFAIYKVTQQIESVAKQRLALEEKITGEFNKQNILAAELNKLRGEAAEKRNFDQFLGGASPEALQKRLAEMTRQQQAAVAEAAELRRRQQTVGSLDSAFRDTSQGGIPIVGKIMPGDYAAKLVDDLAKQAEAAEAKARSFTDRILQLDEAIIDSNRRRADRDVEVTRFAEQAKWDARNDAVKAANEAEKEADKKRKEMVKKAIEDAKKFAEHVKKAGEAVVGIFASTTDNPFVKIFTEGEQAVQRMLEATKGLGSELQNTLKKLIDSQTQSKAFKQSMDNALKATGLRSEAGTFLGKEKPTISQSLQKQLDAIGGGSPFISETFAQGKNGAFTELIKKVDPNQRARDQKIIELTRGMNPEDLTPTQRQQAAAARIREAEALEKEKPDALETQKQLVEVLKKLQEGKSLTIDVNDPNNAATVKNATPQTVNLRFPNQ